MVSAQPAQVVIECPHCGMRYQLPPEAIGPKGREVACADCGKTWHATAMVPPKADEADRMFEPEEEDALDAAFAAEERTVVAPPPAPPPPAPVVPPSSPAPREPEAERMRSIAEIKAAIAPKPKAIEAKVDTAGQKRRQKEFDKRQVARSRQSPLAKVRRVARIAGMSALIGLIVCGVAFRTDVVRQFPDLAGAYEALGLGVNVIGLEFRDVRTLMTLRNGNREIQVDARIFSVAGQPITVPPVVVTLLDENNRALYEWSVAPDARMLNSGEVVDFTTRLSAPPLAASRVRLTFTDGKGRAESPLDQAATPSH